MEHMYGALCSDSSRSQNLIHMRCLDAGAPSGLLFHEDSKNFDRRVQPQPLCTLPALHAGYANARLLRGTS